MLAVFKNKIFFNFLAIKLKSAEVTLYVRLEDTVPNSTRKLDGKATMCQSPTWTKYVRKLHGITAPLQLEGPTTLLGPEMGSNLLHPPKG